MKLLQTSLLVVFLLGISFISKAQRYKFPKEEEKFIGFVAKELKKAKAEYSKRVGEAFSSIWNGTAAMAGAKLTASQKQKIIAISKKMARKRFMMNREYTKFYGMLANGITTHHIASSLDDILEVTEKVVSKLGTREISVYFKNLHTFFIYQKQGVYTLYGTRFNSLLGMDGKFSISFVANDTQSEAITKKYMDVSSADTDPAYIKGAIIELTNINLVFKTPFDSLAVRKTDGAFMITKSRFLGNGGTFDWESLNLDPTKVYCKLGYYNMNVARPILKSRDVSFYYLSLFKTPLKGDFEFQSQRRRNNYVANFPRFISTKNDITMPNIGGDLAVKGAFTLIGNRVYSSAARNGDLARFWGKKKIPDSDEEEVSFLALAKKFQIFHDGAVKDKSIYRKNLGADSLSTLRARQAVLSMYLGLDSLYHPKLGVRYSKEKHQIDFIRDRSHRHVPFLNNHHRFFIHADIMQFDVEKDTMDFYMLGGQGIRPASFESFDFHNQERYTRMIGTFPFHPLKLFTAYAKRNAQVATDEDGNEIKYFYIKDITEYSGRSEGTMKAVANFLHEKGYINYNDVTGKIVLGYRIQHNTTTDAFLKSVDRIKKGHNNARDSTNYVQYDHDNMFIVSLMDTKDTSNSREIRINKKDTSYTVKVSRNAERIPNASLHRTNREMLIRGIETFPVSDSLNVNIKPYNKQVKVYANRAVQMEHGEITVGNFRFIGKEFFFLYETFTLEMPRIDSVLFVLKDTISKEESEYGSEIRFGAGTMQINDAKNKSGRKKGKIFEGMNEGKTYEQFPQLSIPEGGVVYFRTDYRKNFAYDSTTVFEIDKPLEMDSLTSKVPSFKGVFKSKMFPDIKEQMIPLPDKKLGFRHKPPPGGYPLYPEHDKVKNVHIKFNSDLTMTAEGLYGGGVIKYLTTTVSSPEFFFMPDSTTSENSNFTVGKGKMNGAEFANAQGKTAQLNWVVTADSMVFNNSRELEKAGEILSKKDFKQKYREKLFKVYDNNDAIALRGDIIVKSSGLYAAGEAIRRDFRIISFEEPFKFNINSFKGYKNNIEINSEQRDPFEYNASFYTDSPALLQGNFVDVDFDLMKGEAVIKPYPEYADIEDYYPFVFPYAQYKTSIKEALWSLKDETIAMKGDSTSTFTSTIFGGGEINDERDLTFNATNAFYDIKNLSMQLDGIPYIVSADAKIYPNEGKATVLKNAEMQTLKEARLVIDTLNGYHRLFDGEINIRSRMEFAGQATYQFINVIKDTFNIKFDEFKLTDADEIKGVNPAEKKLAEQRRKKGQIVPKHTISQGKVTEDDKFYLTTRILYKGNVKMYADRKPLELDGFIKLDLKSRRDLDNWLPYKSDKGDSVVLDIKKRIKVGKGVYLTSGLHFTHDGDDLYTTFLSPSLHKDDIEVFLAFGNLSYNPAINEFKIEPKEKTERKSFAGNTLIFDDSKSTVYMEGKFGIMDKHNSKYLNSSGAAHIDMRDSTFRLDMFTTVDLPIPPKAMAAMAKNVETVKEINRRGLNQSDTLFYRVAELVGDKDIKHYLSKAAKVSEPLPFSQISKTLQKPIVLSEVPLKWSKEYHTFHSHGKIGLMSILDKEFNTEVDGFFEIRKNPNGDAFSIYLQVSPSVWYFIDLDQDQLMLLSSDEAFNAEIEARAKPGGKGKFGMELAEIDQKEGFLQKFQEVYGQSINQSEEVKKEEKKDDDKKKGDDKKKSDDKKKGDDKKKSDDKKKGDDKKKSDDKKKGDDKKKSDDKKKGDDKKKIDDKKKGDDKKKSDNKKKKKKKNDGF
ncbi:hypothetical protein [uncultured Microscilla sp.]|uniref:hypothetical protein n=1 Tax=uncultured Microscilla sp. TaxID=432653 RepID=UPI002612AF0C|nr:hypothetical protein [uncultured Microscilla sp.]